MVRKKKKRKDRMSITVRGLHHSYGKRKVLKDVSFKVDPGEFVGIIGPNGSGKTTLLRCLIGALKDDKGRIHLGGRDINGLDPLNIARMVGMVPQQTSMDFEFTVEEVVLMGRYPYIDRFRLEDEMDHAIAREAMISTHTERLRDRLVTRLSGGERQRVVIARALTQEPMVLLLDEPTSHLDIRHQLEMLGLIRDLNLDNGLTVIAVFHDLDLASRFCDRLLIMHEGSIMAHGKPEDVLTHGNLREAFGVEAKVVKRSNGEIGLDVLGLSKIS